MQYYNTSAYEKITLCHRNPEQFNVGVLWLLLLPAIEFSERQNFYGRD